MTVRHDLTLATFQEMFEPDGSLVDLYVLDTSPEDWQRLLDELQSEVLPYKYWDFEMDDEPRRLPQRIETIFARGEEASGYLLTLDPEGLRLNCHFFTTTSISLPRTYRVKTWPPDWLTLFSEFRHCWASLFCCVPRGCPGDPASWPAQASLSERVDNST